jgi:4-amino-4-deoxy-L-arabinose transferase-like glycosyltransferase
MRPSTRDKSLIALLLVTYLALAFAYSLASPIYEPTDELRHFRYVRHITVYRSLPVQQPDAPRAQSHHPPLYYALGALVSSWVPVEHEVYYSPPINPHWSDSHWEVSTDNKNQYIHGPEERPPFRGVTLAVYVVRWMTALIGAGVVWLTYEIVRALSPQRPAIAVGGAAIVAFNPQFLHLSSAINNDIAAALCGAAVILACIHLVKNGPHLRYDVRLGLLYGLALLTKFNLLALAAPIALAYILAAQKYKSAYNWRALLRGALVILGLVALISGWWFIRNARLYGDPTGMKMVNELWAGRPASGHWWAVRQSLPYLWSSLWGRFGYGQLPLPRFIYRALLGFFILTLAGHLIPPRLVQSRRLNQSALAENSALILLITVLAFVAVVFYYIMIQPAGAMGRFLFPALPSFAALAMMGLARFFPRRLSWLGGLIATLGMATLALYALIGVLAPAFAPPRPLTAKELHNLPNPTRIEWRMENEGENGEGNSIARLLGYRVEPTAIEPGDALEVTLYWQALSRPEQNLNVFVHLLSDEGRATSPGTMVAQRDTYPGLGRYPTTAWETGVAFADTYRLRIPETAYTPDRGYVQVGLYVPDGPRLITDDGRNAVRLATVKIQPRPGELPNLLEVNFGTDEGVIALVGYELDHRTVRPGEKINLTLYWRALAPMETDYHVFTHILSEGSDQMWGQSDSKLTAESAPTSEWQAGMTVEDLHELRLGLTTPPDLYDIEVGLYRPGEGRLPVIAEDGHWLGTRTLLSKIRVVSE